MVRVFVLVSVFTSVLVAQPADASSALRADAVLAGREAAAVIESVDQGSGDVNCVLGPWHPDPKGDCDSRTLMQPFIRSIVVAPQGNGKACGTPLVQDMPCKPVHCEVGPWSDWLGCVDGRKSRTRGIVVWPNPVGRACPNQVDTVKCRKQDCQVCNWSDWVCDLNSGDQTRTRRVIKPKELDGADCPPLSETKPCELCAPPTNGLHFANEYSFKVWNDVTQPECCAKCGITAGCKAYTFRPKSTTSEKGDCYAKSDTTTQVSGLSNRYVSATVSSPKSCPEPPIGWTEGKPVFCDSDSVTVYRYACGEVRGYPDPTIAASWDPLWRRVTSAQCTSLQKGPPLGFKPCPPQPEGVPEGFPVKCDTTDAIYRSTCGEVRLYRDPAIARSWDIAWAQPPTIDCTDIPRGVDMPKRECSPSPIGIAEGAPIKCSANSNPHLVEDRRRVYRYECNEIRWYPNERIAYSWDPNWVNFVEYDCSSMQVGPDMPEKA